MKNFEVRLATKELIQKDSIVDGEGLRSVIWFQGCPHHCKGCHNPESWAYDAGYKTTIDKLLNEITTLTNQKGITISGGEPFAQLDALLEITSCAKENDLNVWVWTGFIFEDLLEYAIQNSIYEKILNNIDVLVDGPFLIEEKSMNLWFKGSKNQRILDVKKSMKNKTAVLIPKYKKDKTKKKATSIALW